jgi:hypothetical protein
VGTIPLDKKPTQAHPDEPEESTDFLSLSLDEFPDRCFELVKDGKGEVFVGYTHTASTGSIQRLMSLALLRLEKILRNPNIRVADQLRATELVGKWASLDGGLDGAIARVHSAGLQVVVPDIEVLAALTEDLSKRLPPNS